MATTAILSALAQEQQGLIEQLQGARRVQRAGRDYWQGHLRGQSVVLALSRIGKVAAATTTTIGLREFSHRRHLRVTTRRLVKPRLRRSLIN